MRSRVISIALLLASGAAAPGRAQSLSLARADALLHAGRVFSAESLYYEAVSRTPRDPIARLALGRYLAGRGAWKVGAVLMEEARYFGGDAGMVAGELAPVYARLGDFGALAALPASRLSTPERLRAQWLRDHPQAVTGPDSVTVPYRVVDSRTFGRIMLVVGADSVSATVDPRTEGLSLDTSWQRRRTIRRFGAEGEQPPGTVVVGVAPSLGLGDLTLTNVPIRFAPQRSSGAATIGVDLLGKLAPTFDLAAGRMLLRRNGRPTDLRGTHIPTLSIGPEPLLVRSDVTLPLSHPEATILLRDHVWTLLPRKGEIVIDH
ncbi:MAG: hypothetical protein M3068_14995 [Gemmatimonadota bacterium]|nr:hypothetical protein [Gemmatimonadota bacterium]